MMDLLNASYLRASGGYDCTFNFWNDYLGLSTLVTKNRRQGPVSANSITECLKATLGLRDPCYPPAGPGRRRAWRWPGDLADELPLLGPFQAPGLGRAEAETFPDPYGPLDLLDVDRRAPRRPGGRAKQPEARICVFCRNNGAPEDVYASHVLKTPDGRVVCPTLRAYTCPLCNANGDNAHTIKYCPLSKEQPPQRALKGGRAVGGGKRVTVF
ncbi:nanos homolog 1-like [Rhinoraja longicauda]